MPDIRELIARSASDKVFRARLIANPNTVLRDEGFDVPAAARVEVLETEPNEIHLELGEQNRPPKLQAVLDRAQRDLDFRKQFVNNPNKAFEDSMGTKLPPGAVVRIYEPLANGMRVFLPPLQSAPDAELSDAQLEAVAGGGLFSGIREWICKDHRYIKKDVNGNVEGTTLFTSHNPGQELRPSNPTL